jgi:hypothetical protein
MLRVIAALLLACQALPYGAVALCANHRQAAPACAEMTPAGAAAPDAPLAQPHSSGSHMPACPVAQLCAASAGLSLPVTGSTRAATAALPGSAHSRPVSFLPADPIAPPLHPPKV